jgi:hypothetical protein
LAPVGRVGPFVFFVSGVLFETLGHARFDFGPKVTHELDILPMRFDEVQEILRGDVIYRQNAVPNFIPEVG